MSVTRLLVLGAVRIFQPTHGYFVRRELTSWQVAEWAHLNPGSIYNALRALTKDGLLTEEQPDSPISGAKTEYRLTVDGEQEFQRLVREGLWELHPYEPGWLLAGLSFWWALTRDEVLAAFEARAALLTARISGSQFASAGMPQAVGTPEHIVEHFWVHEAHMRGELEWVHAVSERIRDGAYGFQGEAEERRWPAQHPGRPFPDPNPPPPVASPSPSPSPPSSPRSSSPPSASSQVSTPPASSSAHSPQIEQVLPDSASAPPITN